MYLKSILLASGLVTTMTGAAAQEGLQPFAGQWNGSGKYVRLNGNKVNVQCSLATAATSTSLDMNGRCTALVVIGRDLSANIKAEGNRISGRYSGPEGSGVIQGRRDGSTLHLVVQWEKPVRGDTTSDMQIEMIGSDRLRLRTFDEDGSTNSKVAVTDLDLRRE
jgi:hypothetical protein